MSEKSDPEETLPDAEASGPGDLVPVAWGEHPAEAAFLSSIVEDAGIPTVTQGESLTMFQGLIDVRTAVCVSARHAEEAMRVLARQQEEAVSQRVAEAFEPGDKAPSEEDRLRDPMLARIEAIKALPEEELNVALKPLVARWLSDATGPAKIAHYLGHAGLSLKEADRLVHEVAESPILLAEARGGLLVLSLGIALVGALGLIFVAVTHIGTFLTDGLFAAMFGGGIGYALFITRRRPPPSLLEIASSHEARKSKDLCEAGQEDGA